MNPGRPSGPSQPTFHPVNPGRPSGPSQPTFHPVNPQRPQAPSNPGSSGGFHPGPVVRPPVTRPVTGPVGGRSGSRGGHGFVPEKARKAKNGAKERSVQRGHAAHPARPVKKQHAR